jgi:hypothetical protein
VRSETSITKEFVGFGVLIAYCLIQVPTDAALYNALMIAVKHGQGEAVTTLLASGFDINHKDPVV